MIMKFLRQNRTGQSGTIKVNQSVCSQQHLELFVQVLSPLFKGDPHYTVDNCIKRLVFENQAPALSEYKELISSIHTLLMTYTSDDTVVKLLESCLLFSAQFYRAKNGCDITLALMALTQGLTQRSLSANAIDGATKLFSSAFMGIFTPQSLDFDFMETLLDNTRDGIDFMSDISQSPILQKLHKFLMYCLSQGILSAFNITFDTLGYTKFETEAISRAHSSKIGFLHCLVDSVSLFLKQFIKSVKSGSWEPMYHSSSTYEKFIDDALKLKNMEKYVANPEPHGFDIFSYRLLLSSTIDTGETIMRTACGISKFEKTRLKILLSELALLKANDITRLSAQKDRSLPFGIMLSGGSSLGKSTIVTYLFQYYAKLHKLSADTSSKYVRNGFEKHWNGFMTGMWCIILDDIAAISPKLGIMDESLAEVIRLMNLISLIPEQAALEDKGKTPVWAKLVIATTNTEHLNAQAYFSCPLAVQRRLPWVVRVVVKDAFAHNKMLDTSKCHTPSGQYADYWNFVVRKVVPADESGTRGKLADHATFESIGDFLAWYGSETIKHEEVQDMIAKQYVDTKSIEVCKCLHPMYDCVCNQIGYIPKPIHSPGRTGIYRKEDRTFSCDCDADCEICHKCVSHFCSCGEANCEPVCFEQLVSISSTETEFQRVTGCTGGRKCMLCGECRWHICKCNVLEPQSQLIPAPWHQNATSWWSTFSFTEYWTETDTSDFIYSFMCMAAISMIFCVQLLLGTPLSWLLGWTHFTSKFIVNIDFQGMFLRFIFRRLGARIQSKYSGLIQTSKMFIGCAAAMTVGAKMYSKIMAPQEKVWQANEDVRKAAKHVRDLQEDIEERKKILYQVERDIYESSGFHNTSGLVPQVGTAPEPLGEERPNVWYNQTPVITKLDVSPEIEGAKSLSIEQVRKKFGRNCVKIELSVDGITWQRTGAFGLAGQVYAVNKHALPKADLFRVRFKTSSATEGVIPNKEFLVVSTQIYTTPESDTAAIYIKGVPACANLVPYCIKRSLKGIYVGEYLGLNNSLELVSNTLRNIEPAEFLWNREPTPTFSAFASNVTLKGDCGSVMFSCTPVGPIIFGVHALGAPNGVVQATPLFSDEVERIFSYFQAPQIQCGTPKLLSPSAPKHVIGLLHPKSPFRYINVGQARIFGTLEGFRPKPKSRVRRTMMADAAEKFGFVQKCGAPLMNSWLPWSKAITNMVNVPSTFRQDILDECVRSFTKDIIDNLSPDELKLVHVYDEFTAINGAAGVAYVDQINKSTSAGFPWGTTKQKFAIPLPPRGELRDPITFEPEILERTAQIIADYKQRILAQPVFTGHLKDEPTKFEKVKAGKTRVFGGAPLDWSIVVRQYFLGIVRCVQRNRFVWESGPGTIAQSAEWQRMWEYLVAFGLDRLIAGDYGNFDQRMAAILILAAFEVIIGVCKAAGYKDDDLDVLQGIAQDTAFPFFNLNGDMAQFFGVNPSGHPLTVIINGLVNCLYMRYVYFILNPKHEVQTFKDNVHLMTYGDDNVMGVSSSIPWFTHTEIQRVLELHTVVYTMADKEAISKPYVHIDEVSFLKRAWRYDEHVGKHLCPLEWDSIVKSVMTCVESKSVSHEYQCISILTSATMELFFHGKSKFEEYSNILREIAHNSGLDDFITETTFPTYDSMLDKYRSYGPGRHWTEEMLSHNFDHFRPEKSSPEGTLHPQSLDVIETTPLSMSVDSAGICTQEHSIASVANHPASESMISVNFAPCVHVDQVSCGLSLNSTNLCGGRISPLSVDRKLHTTTCGCFETQSDAPSMGTTEVSSVVEETSTTISFLEAPNRYTVGTKAVLPSASYADATPNVSLGEFLSRPVKIYNYTWNESDVQGIGSTIRPWQLFFANAAIANKLVNYAWLKCDLKIKVMLNASPFYYGTTLMSYCPLPHFHDTSITNDAGFRYVIPYSQRPHLWLYPQNNEGGEMILPFVWQKNWITTNSLQDFMDMGSLTFLNVVPLLSANGAVGTGVTISVYAWAENVVVSGPTSGLIQQSDEYGDSPVSTTASAIASAAKALSRIPIIRPFATATQMGASAVASVASKLGYCNTPVIANSLPYRPTAFPVMSTTEQGYPVEKLTVDPKNELSIDPGIVGLRGEDELNIQNLVAKESYVTQFFWGYMSQAEDLLFSSAVTPIMFEIDGSASPKLYMTPTAWVGQMFTYWRGDVIFRFRFICSQFHRGRVRITFDPSGNATNNLLNTNNTLTTCFNEVVDLTKDTNVEVRVPYNQALAWCQTTDPVSATQIPWTNGAGVSFKHVPGFTNGMISVRCVTALTSPLSTASVTCIVSVRGAENLEFAAPCEIYRRYSQFAPQSDEYEETMSQMVIAGNSPSSADPNRYLVNHGEHVVTLRQLARRMQFVRSFAAAVTSSTLGFYSDTFYRMPPAYGFDPNGIHTAKGLIATTVTKNFNNVGNGYINWISMCFLGYRGSINWLVNMEGSYLFKHVSLNRHTGVQTVGATSGSMAALTSSLASAYQVNTTLLGSSCAGGIAITNQATNGTIIASNPMYSAYKMNVTSPGNATLALDEDDTSQQAMRLLVQSNANSSNFYAGSFYAGVGTDWTVHYFLNVPTIFVYNADPVAV